MVRQAREATKRDLVQLLILRRGREKSTTSSLFSCSIRSSRSQRPHWASRDYVLRCLASQSHAEPRRGVEHEGVFEGFPWMGDAPTCPNK